MTQTPSQAPETERRKDTTPVAAPADVNQIPIELTQDHCQRSDQRVMIIRSRPLCLLLLGFFILGCTASRAQTPTRDEQGVLRGSVAYRERVALPPDAVVEVWLIDVSPLIVPLALIAETTVPSQGRQVPIPFELRYDPKKIQPDHIYGVKAAIRSAGQILFETTAPRHVITQGNPSQVELWLQRAAP